MTFGNIHKMANQIKKAAEGSEQISTAFLYQKLDRNLAANQDDKTLGLMHRVIGGMQDRQAFISRAQLRGIYNRFYSNGTGVGELCAEELGIQPAEWVEKVPQKSAIVSQEQFGDQVLANAISSIINKEEIKMYSAPMADKCLKSVGRELNSFGLKPKSLSVATGNESFIVVRADYETPKGITSFFVPLDSKAQVEVFMGNGGIKDFTAENIKSYVISNAGVKLNVQANTILDCVKMSNAKVNEISDIEYALIKLNSRTVHTTDGILGLKVDDLEKIAAAAPLAPIMFEDEFSLEGQFTKAAGKAKFIHSEKVRIAQDVVSRELKGFGFTNPQLKIVSCDNNKIYWGVSLGKLAFTVPVEVSKEVMKPKVMICNGSLKEFSKAGIDALQKSDETDFFIKAQTSVYSKLSNEELLNVVSKATIEGNMDKAEDALNVIQASGDVENYRKGLRVMLKGLNSEAFLNEKHECSKQIKRSSSQHMICTHTGLPVNRVYQDKNGNCLPLHHQK